MSTLFLSHFRPSITKKLLSSAKDPASNKVIYFFVFDVRVVLTKTYEWQIKKKYSDFMNLSQGLASEVSKGGLLAVPWVPAGESFTSSTFESKFLQLEEYLKDLERMPEVCMNPSFWEFLEVSALSFDGTSSKRKEGYVLKRTGGRINNEKMCCNISKHFRRLQRRWVILRDNMIGYLSSHTKEFLHEVLIFKGKFEVSCGREATGFEDGVLITTSRRNFLFRAGDILSRTEWVEAITEAYEQSEWRNADLMFDSSFPPRLHNEAKWFVDGLNYFHEVVESLKKAQREVYISDWWLSPNLYLKRPSTQYPDSQLLEVIGALADRGVSVYVHVYKEVSFVLTLNSLHTKRELLARNPNIKIVRHPHRTVVGSQFLWSHHEKVVCIDQETAFLGGLDLCYGRMDTSEHLLSDLSQPYVWNGIDYSNVRIADFFNVENWERDLIDRNCTPRMPWHDIGIKIVGKAALDVSLHFIELWNHVMTDISGDYWKNKNLLQPKIEEEPDTIIYDTIISYSTSVLERDSKSMLKRDTSKSVQHSRKYSMFSNTSVFKRIDVSGFDRMIDSEEINPTAITIQNIGKFETEVGRTPSGRYRNQTMLGVSKKMNYEELDTLDELTFKNEIEADFQQGDEFWAKNLLLPKFKKLKKAGSCNCQVVRSAGPWSLGLDKAEHSVHAAYLHLIDEANHFIYIENQFFISSTAGKPVKNQIAQALVERIKIAASLQENFKVIVMMPLLPGFEGRIEDSPIIRAQLHWEYSTINRGICSIIQQLSQDPNIKNPEDYITFASLRNHGAINGLPVSEMVYIHSKLMIVDDDVVIIGSANINDRSLLGKRDSEIAVVVNDANKVRSVMGGEHVEVSEFAHMLRMNLFKEFLNNGDEEVLRDPLSDRFSSLWQTTAQNNTTLYRHIFRCYPDDEIRRLEDIREFEKKACIDEYFRLKDGFKGMLVEFPLRFLDEENLKMSIFNKEFLLPEENFV